MNFRNTELSSRQPVAEIHLKRQDVEGDGLVTSCDGNSDVKRKGTQLQTDRETTNTMRHEQGDDTKKADNMVRQSFFFVQSVTTLIILKLVRTVCNQITTTSHKPSFVFVNICAADHMFYLTYSAQNILYSFNCKISRKIFEQIPKKFGESI